MDFVEWMRGRDVAWYWGIILRILVGFLTIFDQTRHAPTTYVVGAYSTVRYDIQHFVIMVDASTGVLYGGVVSCSVL